jgi:hypothetical protein
MDVKDSQKEAPMGSMPNIVEVSGRGTATAPWDR